MAADPLSSQPPGFATLAKRVSAWTTNGLLTVIVLVAGLGFGRQVLTWWAADASSPPGSSAITLPADDLGDPSQLHILQFGDNSWSMRRRSVAGDKSKAVEQLRAACREVLTSSPLPKSGEGPGVRAASEEKFLGFLFTSTPVDEHPGKWRLYELQQTFPMAVGLARPVDQASLPAKVLPHPSTEVGRSEESNLAQMGYRVVIWGVAVPTTATEWALYTFQSEGIFTEAASALANVPLPPGCRRTLSMRAALGGGIVALSGPDRPADWKRFYDDWFTRQGWQPAASWQPVGAAWYAKFASPDRGDSIDVRFGPDGRGGLSGLLMITPRESK